MLMIILAVLPAVESDTGYAKAYHEITSIAVTMLSQPPFGGSFGWRSTCITSSEPKSQSGILSSSGVVCELSVRLHLMQI